MDKNFKLKIFYAVSIFIILVVVFIFIPKGKTDEEQVILVSPTATPTVVQAVTPALTKTPNRTPKDKLTPTVITPAPTPIPIPVIVNVAQSISDPLVQTDNTIITDKLTNNENIKNNLTNGGYIAKDGEDLYFSSSAGLFKKTDTGLIKIIDKGVTNLIICDDKILGLSDSGLISINKDEQNSKILESASGLCLAYDDGFLYYDNYNNNNYIFSSLNIRTMEIKKQVYNRYPGIYFNYIRDGFLYERVYVMCGKDYYCKISIDNLNEEIKFEHDFYDTPIVQGNWMYVSDSTKLYRINLDNDTEEHIIDTESGINAINIKDDWIYYSLYSGGTYKVRLNGSSNQKISDETGSSLIILGNKIYISSYDDYNIFELDIT
ncbi:MAG: DUF5050 domain-containing protein [Clostridiales bacterium]|nr:DUF5050 domain-containing protein [Clostridiales bacterium]